MSVTEMKNQGAQENLQADSSSHKPWVATACDKRHAQEHFLSALEAAGPLAPVLQGIP